MTRPRQRGTTGAVDRYLHAILLLTEHGRPADTGDVAKKVGVSDAAASRMFRTLASRGLVRVEAYQGAELTTEGLHCALRVVRRHRLLETFLHERMGFDLREAHERAMLMQPSVDEVFADRLDEMLGSPRFDPHGQPIPSKNATWPKLADCPLLDLPPGTAGRVSRVTSDDANAITYLEGQGVATGAAVVLVGVSPFDGPVAVRVGDRVVHLGRRLASTIHVAEDAPTAAAQPRRLRGGKRRIG